MYGTVARMRVKPGLVNQFQDWMRQEEADQFRGTKPATRTRWTLIQPPCLSPSCSRVAKPIWRMRKARRWMRATTSCSRCSRSRPSGTMGRSSTRRGKLPRAG